MVRSGRPAKVQLCVWDATKSLPGKHRGLTSWHLAGMYTAVTDGLSLQTPDASRSRSNPSWVADLDAYIASHEGTPGGDRHTLVSNVKLNPQSAEAWRSLMAYEESHSANNTYGLHAATAVDNNKVSLYHVYYWATQLVPRSKNQHKEAYLQLWLGFARQQW